MTILVNIYIFPNTMTSEKLFDTKTTNQKENMNKKWEYDVICANTLSTLKEILTISGKEGWELVNFVRLDFNPRTAEKISSESFWCEAVMKREKI